MQGQVEGAHIIFGILGSKAKGEEEFLFIWILVAKNTVGF